MFELFDYLMMLAPPAAVTLLGSAMLFLFRARCGDRDLPAREELKQPEPAS
jgi:hypothetical protein